MRKALIIPDVHAGFHSVKAWDVMLKFAIDFKPDEITILGDFIDCLNLSGHGAKSPAIAARLEDEVNASNSLLDQLDSLFPEARKVYIEGNHETRFERFIVNKCPELFGITELKFLLKIPSRVSWTWVNYGPNQKHAILGSKILARHEPLKNQPHLTLREAGTSLFYGHVHKRQWAEKVFLTGRRDFAACPGWLGNPRSPAASYIKGIQDWQHGFATLEVEGRNCVPKLVTINEDFTVYENGTVYRP